MKKEKQNKLIQKNIVVLYHNGCHDGFGGAWVAWRKFKNKADYIGLEHNAEPPAELVGRELYFIDFCYPEPIMDRLLHRNKKIVVLDHHITRREAVKISTEHVFDNDHSGSVLAWKYFFPGEKTPRLLRNIEDVDLWKFTVPYTKELMAAMDEYPFDFKVWSKIAAEFEDKEGIKKYLEAGKTILKYEDRVVDRLIRHAEKVELDGHVAYAVNSPILESEIGNWIVTHRKAIGIIWSRKSGLIKVSLRSDGKTDVSKLAERHGGGGHKAAAGFAFDADEAFPWVKVDFKKK